MSVKAMAWVWNHSRSTPTQRLVLLAIADCANEDGLNAYPSIPTLCRKTGLSDRGVQRAIDGLTALGELFVSRGGGRNHPNQYRVIMTVNPDPDSPNQVHPDPDSVNDGRVNPEPRSPRTISEPSESSPTENSSPPKRTKRRPKPTAAVRPDVERLCAHLADRIEANGSKRPTVTQAWRDAARRLIDRDGKTVDQITKAIDWCQDDEFWRGNILSMPKLREQYDRLRLAAQRVRGSPGSDVAVRNGRKPSTTDQRVADALALAQRLREQEARHAAQ